MNIKKQIKNYDITLSTLADNLFISRPTLNSYIYLYENNKKIPSRRYQIIFDKLFSKEKTIKEFYDILKRYNKLLAKDEILEITELSPEYSDLISAVVNSCPSHFFSIISTIRINKHHSFSQIIVSRLKMIAHIVAFQ